MIKAKKSLGQNFLVDENILKKIVDISEIQDRSVLEIGPGTGNLTSFILKNKPKKLFVVEKDKDLVLGLRKKFKDFLVIINEDILDIDEKKFSKEKLIVFGNLPYNISTEILCKWILNLDNDEFWFECLILMFQKEVAEKIIGKSYGRLSIIAGLKLNFLDKFEVSPNCFSPKPKVKSTLVHMSPKKIQFKIKNLNNLEKITNIFFSNKRKMVNKSLRKILTKNQIAHIEKKYLNLRPENLKPKFYYKLVELIENG